MVARDPVAVKIGPSGGAPTDAAVQKFPLAVPQRPFSPLLLVAQPSGTVSSEALMAARPQIVCTQCDKPEEFCTCEKYCTICKGQHNIRLCADGLYYCPDCREACDVALANER
jgi:hypothetical protein